MTFGERWPLVEDNLWWKMTFGGRRPLGEDDLHWKTTLSGKMTFNGRQPSVEDNLWWKMTFGGRRLSVDDNLQWNFKHNRDCPYVWTLSSQYAFTSINREWGWGGPNLSSLITNIYMWWRISVFPNICLKWYACVMIHNTEFLDGFNPSMLCHQILSR